MVFNVSGTFTLPVLDIYKVIQTQDVYLFCDTSSAPVIINLPSISDFGGFMNVKVYISDISNNAASKTIQINSPLGNSINDNPYISINTNGGSGLIQISGISQYLFTPSNIPSGGDKNFVFNQNTPAVIWNVTHNLNKFPSVSVVDSANTEVIGNVQYINLNVCILSFSGAFSGSAYFN
jgi:hypothetical protein